MSDDLPDDEMIMDALAFSATVGGEFDRWVTWAVATIRDRNAEIERLRGENDDMARHLETGAAMMAELIAERTEGRAPDEDS